MADHSAHHCYIAPSVANFAQPTATGPTHSRAGHIRANKDTIPANLKVSTEYIVQLSGDALSCREMSSCLYY